MAPRLQHSVMTITSTDASRVPIVAVEKGCKAAVTRIAAAGSRATSNRDTWTGCQVDRPAGVRTGFVTLLNE